MTKAIFRDEKKKQKDFYPNKYLECVVAGWYYIKYVQSTKKKFFLESTLYTFIQLYTK